MCAIMAIDEYGRGQFVQFSLIQSNADWHLNKVVDHFKAANDTAWEAVRVIMVDKDFREINVFKEAFPDARILLCTFHVLKWLKGEMKNSNKKYGRYSSSEFDEMYARVSEMTYAEDEATYVAARDAMFKVTQCKSFGVQKCDGKCRGGEKCFAAYFKKNWDKDETRAMWSRYLRNDLPHFQVRMMTIFYHLLPSIIHVF